MIMLKMLSDYNRWRFSTVTLMKLDNHFLDLAAISVKVFIQKINNKNYIVFQFETTPPTIQHTDLQTNSIINVLQTFLVETSNYLNSILTLILIAQSSPHDLKKYASTIKLNTLKYNYFLSNMRD